MSAFTIDHLVVTAPNLALGAKYVQDALGVDLQPGGEHVRLGTHNRLLRLGESMYLEVIAVNPQAPVPQRARWFALDQVAADGPAKLVTWVLQCDDIQAGVKRSSLDFGSVEPMYRGDLQWQITIPDDGKFRLEGALPSLIEWQGESPVGSMVDAGCTLQCLEIHSAFNRQLDKFLSQLSFQGPVMVHQLPEGRLGYLVAQIETPGGLCTLGGPI